MTTVFILFFWHNVHATNHSYGYTKIPVIQSTERVEEEKKKRNSRSKTKGKTTGKKKKKNYHQTEKTQTNPFFFLLTHTFKEIVYRISSFFFFTTHLQQQSHNYINTFSFVFITTNYHLHQPTHYSN